MSQSTEDPDEVNGAVEHLGASLRIVFQQLVRETSLLKVEITSGGELHDGLEGVAEAERIELCDICFKEHVDVGYECDVWIGGCGMEWSRCVVGMRYDPVFLGNYELERAVHKVSKADRVDELSAVNY